MKSVINYMAVGAVTLLSAFVVVGGETGSAELKLINAAAFAMSPQPAAPYATSTQGQR